MLNKEDASQAIQLLFEGSGIQVGNAQPFIRTYQGNGLISPPDDFNIMLLQTSTEVLTINLVAGVIPVTGDTIKGDNGAIAKVGNVAQFNPVEWNVELLSVVGNWSGATLWSVNNSKGGILFDQQPVISLQYIFYGEITANLFTDGQNIKEKITLNYFLDTDPNGQPVNSLYFAFTFLDNVPESRNFSSKGLFVQQILIDNNQMGSISLDGYLFAIQQQ